MFRERNYELKNGKTLTVRAAREDDAEMTIDFVNRIASESDFLTFGADEFGMTVEQERVFIRAINEKDFEFFINAVVDDKIVGNLILNRIDRPRLRHKGKF